MLRLRPCKIKAIGGRLFEGLKAARPLEKVGSIEVISHRGYCFFTSGSVSTAQK